MNDLIKAAAELKPQAKTWLTLTNIRLAINLVFDTIYKLLHLTISIAIIYGVYEITPWTKLIHELNK